MKNIIKYLLRDKVSLFILMLTTAFAIAGEIAILYILPLFILRGIIWEGKYVDALQKYVDDPEARKLLRLDAGTPNTIIGTIFDIVAIAFVLFVCVYVIVT